MKNPFTASNHERVMVLMNLIENYKTLTIGKALVFVEDRIAYMETVVHIYQLNNGGVNLLYAVCL